MPEMITLWDGNTQTLLSFTDFLFLVDEYMGMDSRVFLEKYIADLDYYEGEEE